MSKKFLVIPTTENKFIIRHFLYRLFRRVQSEANHLLVSKIEHKKKAIEKGMEL